MNDKKLIEKYVDKNKQEKALEMLKSGYPIQYIIGNVDFYGYQIKVNENVLIPRFETEYLVDDLIKYIYKYNINNPKILDIGTGSGCISIALSKTINCSVTGIDINSNAIDVAKENALINNANINYINTSIEDYNSNEKYDVIVSNPPYVAIDEYVDEKTKYEPQNAIFAEDNGLYFYKIILEKSKSILNKKNIIAFEIGSNQQNQLEDIVKEYYKESIIIFKNDLNNLNRYLYIINE